MTNNGNIAQKHLIKVLTETHQEPKTAYKQAIATAPSKEAAVAIKRIYNKLTHEVKISYEELNKLIENKKNKILKLFNFSYAVFPKMKEYPNIMIYFAQTKELDESGYIQVNYDNGLSISEIMEL